MTKAHRDSEEKTSMFEKFTSPFAQTAMASKSVDAQKEERQTPERESNLNSWISFHHLIFCQ